MNTFKAVYLSTAIVTFFSFLFFLGFLIDFVYVEHKLACCREMQCCVTNSTLAECIYELDQTSTIGYQAQWMVRLTPPNENACSESDALVVFDEADGLCEHTKTIAQQVLDRHSVNQTRSERCFLCECNQFYVTSNVQWKMEHDQPVGLIVTAVFSALMVCADLILYFNHAVGSSSEKKKYSQMP